MPVKNGRYETKELPKALYGTFWITSPTDELASVFSRQDSVDVKELQNDNVALLQANIGKSATVWLTLNSGSAPQVESGTLEKVEKLMPPPGYSTSNNYRVHLRTTTGNWLTFNAIQIARIDFPEKPKLDFESKTLYKKTEETLAINFKNTKPEQEIGMLYLTNNLGWAPVYSLTLAEKGKSRLSLRAEIANDAEDLGDAELRLAVGVPNFRFANRPDWMVDFASQWMMQQNSPNYFAGAQRVLRDNYMRPEVYNYLEETTVSVSGENFEGAQAEDFFFYTVKPGNFPKNSRYQFPIFETEVEPAHFYECRLPGAGPNSFTTYYDQRPNPNEPKNPVSHYVEFTNPTQFPFTTGVANILSQSGGVTYPLSQDDLPYTPPTAKCKVKIAQTPEIKVTHGEGDVERKENTFLFFSRSYDEVKVEGQVYAVNYKKEPVTLKIRRNIEGAPLSSEQKWTSAQEQATLRVNPSFEVEWVIELKPGEEKKWKYAYKVYVDL
ncbi:MAG: DUF4139 domain-containing protein [Lewinellaceae bacterium]|nr:DUF4139 domain-containing protein [Lewinellaceae bacterium]